MKFLTSIVFILFCINTTAQTFNYAEALQKSIYFYDANKCGNEVANGRLLYRGNCHITDAVIPLNSEMTNLSDGFIEQYRTILDADGNNTLDLAGGYHDAGDHVKFGLPQSYSSSNLEIAMYEFKDAFINIGEFDHMMEILHWASDYYLKCTFRDSDGSIVAFCYQVGEGNIDHNEWSPPELIDTEKLPRPAYFATKETPASDQCAGAAASLAISYLNNIEINPEYANECLDVAKALYDFSVNNRGIGYDGGFYNSSFDEDELSWAAIWLYIATSNETYLNDIISQDDSGMYTGWMRKIINSIEDDWQNIWVHSWDTKWGGVFAKLAPITDDPFHWWIFRWNLEYWSGVEHENSNDGNYLAKTPAGFSYLSTWGSARYNAAAQMQGMIYKKYADNRFDAWMTSQINYILGDNPLGRSYMVGYSDNYAKHPHHRAAHGSPSNSMFNPVEHKHILWGALVGGPGPDDEHNDETSDFIYNEVAIDYNAGLVCALAGHYYYNGEGQEPIADFPIADPPLIEYSIKAKMHEENIERSQLSIQVMNESAFPPRKEVKIMARYYFNISEIEAYGQTIDDVSFAVYYDQSAVYGDPTTAIGPIAYDADNGIYYMEFQWPETGFYGSCEYQFGLIAAPDDNSVAHWDPTNDFSRQGIEEEYQLTNYVQLFADGVLISGEEPGETVTNLDPVIMLSANPISSYSIPAEITFNASESYDPESHSLSFSWDFGDGATGVGEIIQHTYTDYGTYVATVTVSDSVNVVTESITIAILEDCTNNSVPTSVISASVTTGEAPLTVSFNGDASSDIDEDDLTYLWDFGDGTTSNMTSPEHTYTQPGSYTTTLTVTDRCFESHSTSIIMTIEPAPAPCDSPESISLPHAYTGQGDYCWVTADEIKSVNSWNMDKVEINGIDYTNTWSSSLPAKVNGYYYIHFNGLYEWSHIEVNSTLKIANSINKSINNSITVFPNPFTSMITIDFKEITFVKETVIYSLDGKVLRQNKVDKDVHKLSVGEELLSGTYILKVITNKNVHTTIINKQ